MGYTASDAIERLKVKGWLSTATSLTDPQIVELLDDSLRSYVVPFLKEARDEWFVTGSESVTPDANGRITMPNSVASTIRTIEWLNSGQPLPLPRIEPESAFLYEGSNAGSGVPVGFVLRGYGIQILPPTVGSITVRLRFMERPAAMVLEEDAALIDGVAGAVLTLADVPLAWQAATPDAVDIISSESPFSPVTESAGVVSLVGSTLTLAASFSDVEAGFWVSDVGTSPYPNIPIELHPLLELDVIRTLFEGQGDKRLAGIAERQKKMEQALRKTLTPRTQGSSRPLLNPVAPGMRLGRRWGW